MDSLPQSLKFFYLSDNTLGNFNPTVALPTSLSVLEISNIGMDTFDPTLPLPSGLEMLFLDRNTMSTFNPTLPLPITLTHLSLQSTHIAIFDPTNSNLSNLSQLALSNTPITTFNPTQSLLKLSFLSIGGCSLLLEFNPVGKLSSLLTYINASGNSITTDSLNNNVEWISDIGNNGSLYWYTSLNPIVGTETHTLLLAKGWNILM